MARKSTTCIQPGSKREEMRALEKELIKKGFRPRFWKRFGRRLVSVLTLLVIFFALAWSIRFLWSNYISRYDGLSFKELELKTNGVILEDQVLQLMGLQGKEVLLSLDVDALEQKLMAFPAIRKATVRRELPSTLCVEIDARVPIAWLDCPKLGIRSHDVEHGMFVDADGVVFPCHKEIHKDYMDCPILSVPPPDEGEISPGEKVEILDCAVDLIVLIRREKSEFISKLSRISIRNEWSYLVEFEDGCEAVFGVYDTERQVENFLMIQQNARKTHRKIRKINLIQERNVPVEYDRNYENIPIAEPVTE